MARLMHDFFCIEPSDMYYSELAERMRYLKEKEDVVEMSSIVEEITERGIQQGREEEIRQVSKEVAFRMIEFGKFQLEEIAYYTGLSIDEVKALAEETSK